MAKKGKIGRRRRKSNTDDKEAKRCKTRNAAAAVSDTKNRLVSVIKAIINSMNEEHLYSVMVYAGTVGKEEQTNTPPPPPPPPPATATATAATTTTEIAGAKTTTTTTTRGVPTESNRQAVTANSAEEDTTPATPQPTQEVTPPPIQFTRTMRPDADTIVK